MDIFKMCAVAICAIFTVSAVRQLKSEFSLYISLGCCVLLLFAATNELLPVFRYTSELLEKSTQGQRLSTLLRALGVALITSYSAEICRDAGEKEIGAKIELLGKCEIVILSLPLMRELIALIESVSA